MKSSFWTPAAADNRPYRRRIQAVGNIKTGSMLGQKNKVLSLAANEWVLSLDADEELSPELREEIRA
jgi:hypothetical protein